MRPFRFNFTRRIGRVPGSLDEEKHPELGPPEISLFQYDKSGAQYSKLSNRNEIHELPESDRNLWLNISGVHDTAVLQAAASSFGIHSIAAEDIQHTVQRPKAEEYGDQLF